MQQPEDTFTTTILRYDMEQEHESKLYRVTDELGNICAINCFCVKEEYWNLDEWLELATWYTEYLDNAEFIREALERKFKKLGLRNRRVTII